MTLLSDFLSKSSQTITSVPLGGYADVFTSGDAYKIVGSIISRAAYPEMSTAFPRSGALNAIASGALPANQPWQSVAYGNGQFVAVGASTSATSTAGASSPDGANWSAQLMPPAYSFRAIAFGTVNGGLFVAMGDNNGASGTSTSFATSPDGVSWTARALPVAAFISNVIWSKELSMFIASCGNFTFPQAFTSVLTSPDGITWTARVVPSGIWLGMASGPAGVVVACTGNNADSTALLSSADGITFTARAVPAARWSSIAYGRGLYVMVGWTMVTSVVTAKIATSPDGINWTTRVVPGQPTLIQQMPCIIYGDGVFVAFWSGLTLTSTDGITWAARPWTVGTTALQAAYNNGVIVLGSNAAQTAVTDITVENLTDSAYMYLSGTTGKYLRVR